jgi:hypothetical protein
MKRLGLRIPDNILAALRRELLSEREYRGARYSMNDLCVRKLSSRVAAASEPRVHPMLVPPPPPLPQQQVWTLPSVAEPQPERSLRVSSDAGLRVTDFESEATRESHALIAGSNPAPAPILETISPLDDAILEDTVIEDQHAEELMDLAIERMESEGAPDGHLDH